MLENATDPGSVQYLWAAPAAAKADGYDFSVNLALRPAGADPAYGGLLFNFRGPQSYLGVVVGSDGRSHVVVRGTDGFQMQPIADAPGPKGDGSDVISAQVRGKEAKFFLNGQYLLGLENRASFSPQLGIIAVGAGRFGYTGFQVSAVAAAPEPPPLPLPGGNTPPPLPGGDTPPPLPGGNTPPPLPGSTQGQPPGAGTEPGWAARQAGLEPLEASLRLGVTLGVFFHELGHAVIGETKLASTGPEEDQADNFSAFVMASILAGVEEPSHENFLIATQAAALLWYFMGKEGEENGAKIDWQDEHAPDLVRFRNWFCVLYGSDPGGFQKIADKTQMNPRTEQRCREEYQTKFDAWEELLATRSRDLGPDNPGAYPKDAPGGRILLTFQPSATEFGKQTEILLRDSQVIAQFLKLFEVTLVWPRDLHVTFRDCREINAWYSHDDGSVTMCYSAIEFFTAQLHKGLGLDQGKP